MSELGSYATCGALVFKTNTKEIGFLIIFRLFKDAIHMPYYLYNKRAIDRLEERPFSYLQI
jgi:hypothetical protein